MQATHAKEDMLPMVLTPGVVAQGDGGVPDVTPSSGIGTPVVFFRKHRDVASTNVKPTQCTAADAFAQAPQHSLALLAAVGGAAMVPIELMPGDSVHEAPGLPTEPETTALSGVIGSSLFLRLWSGEKIEAVCGLGKL